VNKKANLGDLQHNELAREISEMMKPLLGISK
jgi:hypothetical protein